jgi:hypothetical protein
MEVWNQILSVFIQSGNKMNECISETQKNFINESIKQNEKLFLEYQSIINDLSKLMGQPKNNEPLINKEQATAEPKRKPVTAVMVQ